MTHHYLTYFHRAKEAAYHLTVVPQQRIQEILLKIADRIAEEQDRLLSENARDLALMSPDNPLYDRLQLTPARLVAIAGEMRNVAHLPTPIGQVLEAKILDNQLEISRIAVPLGVVGMIYEARPNVTFDVFALCMRSGNVALLKGGSDADHSNRAIVTLLQKVLKEEGLDPHVVQLLPPDRAAADALMQAVGWVDVIVPRGSQRLINHVRQHARVPVIETGAGIVHTYFDKSGDLEKGKNIVLNAKTRRVSVCNALDCLVIHRDRLPDLPELAAPLAGKQVEIFADHAAFKALEGHYPEALLHAAEEEHFGTEFLSHKMAIKTVNDLEGALAHIRKYSSQHSEAIVAEDEQTQEVFLQRVDAAAVYANTSTAFTDGAQFGLGAELGISTQKLHARGPMALTAMTSYKWVIRGNGQVRG